MLPALLRELKVALQVLLVVVLRAVPLAVLRVQLLTVQSVPAAGGSEKPSTCNRSIEVALNINILWRR